MRIRNHFWATEAAGPQDEMDRQQMLYDSWGQGRVTGGPAKHKAAEELKDLRKNMGIELQKKGDWVFLAQVFSGKDAAAMGLKKGDRLIAIDGQSLRYLPVEAVRGKMLLPHHSDFKLDFERDCLLPKGENTKAFKDFGLKLKLEYEGISVEQVDADSLAQNAGLKSQDFLVKVDGVAVRYLPLGKVEESVGKSKENSVLFTIRRSAMLGRN